MEKTNCEEMGYSLNMKLNNFIPTYTNHFYSNNIQTGYNT